MQIELNTHLEDYVHYILGHNIKNSYQHLLLACMPKSGSTWLSSILSNLPGFQAAQLVNGWERREQELSEVHLLLNHRCNYVAQMHIRYSQPTAALIQRFSLKPVLLVRNIFDIVPSIRDHWISHGTEGPACYLKEAPTDWPQDRIDKFIVDMGFPWYFNFFLSWTECEHKLLVTYEELRQNPQRIVERICEYHEIEATPSEINDSIRKVLPQSTRLNKAQVGRGRQLSCETKQRILEMASYYEGIDFTPIGISAENCWDCLNSGEVRNVTVA
jgi:hypothetical protein